MMEKKDDDEDDVLNEKEIPNQSAYVRFVTRMIRELLVIRQCHPMTSLQFCFKEPNFDTPFLGDCDRRVARTIKARTKFNQTRSTDFAKACCVTFCALFPHVSSKSESEQPA